MRCSSFRLTSAATADCAGMLSAMSAGEWTDRDDARLASPPVPPRREVPRELHGHTRSDAYAWLRDVTDPEVLAGLAAERAYYDVATAHLDPLVRTLSAEMASRVPATDSSVSYRRVNFSYYTLTPSGSEYAQLCRRVYQPGTDGDGIDTGWRIRLSE